jgi:hypothetical protein
VIGRLSFSSAPVSGENLPHEMELSLPANPSALFQPLYPMQGISFFASFGPSSREGEVRRGTAHTPGDYRILSKSRSFSSAIGTRSCFMLSRSRNVTVSRFSGPFSPIVSKSMVTPKGVPASSCRR